jgi:hypothetical protein
VHCAQGVSRSASVLIGYLMAREGSTYEAALSQLQAARPCVAPNRGFALQLQEFGRSGCCLERWAAAGGWDAQRLDECFAQVRPTCCFGVGDSLILKAGVTSGSRGLSHLQYCTELQPCFLARVLRH